MKAGALVETYGCPDPFALSDMEDIAIAVTAKRMGMLDRLIIIRDSVNMDVYMLGTTPESTWGEQDSLSANDSIEVLDIFDTAMKNNFKVGKVVIDAILEGKIA